MKEYTISEFVKGYEKCTTDLLKQRYIKERLVLKTPYISIMMKIELSKNIADHFLLNNTGDYIKSDSVLKYLFFRKTLIQQYTNLICESPGFWDEYDMLKKADLLDKVTIDIIPESEYLEFSEILEMVWEDSVMNYLEIHTFIDRQSFRIKEVIEQVFNPVADKLSEIIDGMSEKDDKKIAKIIKGILDNNNK